MDIGNYGRLAKLGSVNYNRVLRQFSMLTHACLSQSYHDMSIQEKVRTAGFNFETIASVCL